MNYFIEKEWLLEHLQDKNIRIADCRYNLGLSEEGYDSYVKDHIPGAVYFHLSKDLSGPVSVHGGRHPLPAIEDLQETFSLAGISEETTVIAYDGGEGSYAARLWWLLNYVGHEKVYILNGGYKAWKDAGYPTNDTIPTYLKTEFKVHLNDKIFASQEEVKKMVEAKNDETVIIDSRENKRYLGMEEPIDKKAGHIPGAINKVWTEGFENGRIKSIKEQEKRFKEIDKDKQVIVYCGSGVTATPNFIALKMAGYNNVKLYAGSFSDWITYEENEVETGKNVR
ncbi:sulfurtransferase [Cytobacillus solani]|uniref:3-mercaptopyruvate sulfurtransferase n=1 Tax=Cytobacillus solani TaxID=1637975 RepID=A0A0Q3VIK1_9BACI|nr:sulfurtransferase [Cytobacillus solani]KOP83167.1 3-mercaptopyruvate sulfurtransferase [Bacillus sp. FJAT-21945]KQL20194.1 3-mercaptopyruvate sulfurtransferase [Cytobacillus solani]USK53447.1 sulfurtransferase [Cytobacillus solani]